MWKDCLNIINRPNMPVQIIFAGKAHPADEPGKQLIQQVYRTVKRAETGGRLVFVEDYDMNLARYLVQGVDVWMNTPRRPIRGERNFGHEGSRQRRAELLCAGWLVARSLQRSQRLVDWEDRDLDSPSIQDEEDAESLYDTLENEIIPLFYERDPKEISHEWIARMKDSMKTNIPQFSTRRMVKEYVERLYVKALK